MLLSSFFIPAHIVSLIVAPKYSALEFRTPVLRLFVQRYIFLIFVVNIVTQFYSSIVYLTAMQETAPANHSRNFRQRHTHQFTTGYLGWSKRRCGIPTMVPGLMSNSAVGPEKDGKWFQRIATFNNLIAFRAELQQIDISVERHDHLQIFLDWRRVDNSYFVPDCVITIYNYDVIHEYHSFLDKSHWCGSSLLSTYCPVVYNLDKYMVLAWSVASCTETHRKPQLTFVWTVLSRMD